MTGEETPDLQVPNPYLAAIRSAKESSSGPLHTLRTALAPAVTAMEAGAWTGGRADDFFATLSGWRTDGTTAASRAEQEFDEAIGGQPAEVGANSWQVHWHNLGP
jgi:hypothetical protein